MTFVNPTNGYQKRFYNIRLWYFFFGIFYLIVHGLWKELLIVFLTCGLAHLYYMFALPGAIKDKYLQAGWKLTHSTNQRDYPNGVVTDYSQNVLKG